MVESPKSDSAADGTVRSESRQRLVMECRLDFFDWLIKTHGVTEKSAHDQVKAVLMFLRRVKDLRDVQEYAQFVVDYVVKKRCLPYKYALKNYISFKFHERKDIEFKDKVLEAMKYIRHEWKQNLRIPKVLDDQSVRAIIDNIQRPRFKLIAEIQSALGVRVGDILRMEVNDLDYELFRDRSVLAISFRGKGKKRYKMWVFDETLQKRIEEFVASEYDAGSQYVFLPRFSAQRTSFHKMYLAAYLQYWRMMKKSMFKIGVRHDEWSTHDFRRAMARRLWNKYGDIMMIKEFLHHENFETTARYMRGMGLQVQEVQSDLYEDIKKEADVLNQGRS
jgi:integrase